jgi:hypothetical protein
MIDVITDIEVLTTALENLKPTDKKGKASREMLVNLLNKKVRILADFERTEPLKWEKVINSPTAQEAFEPVTFKKVGT